MHYFGLDNRIIDRYFSMIIRVMGRGVWDAHPWKLKINRNLA